MLELFKQNVLYPLVGRVGTSASTALVTMGVTQQHADWVQLGMIGVAGVAFDLVSSWVRRRSIIDQTFNEVLGWINGGDKP